VGFILYGKNGLFGFSDNLGIVFRFPEFDEFEVVGKVLFQLFDKTNLSVELVAFAKDFLCFFLVVPKVWIFRKGVQLIKTEKGDIPVKDASSADQASA